MTDTPDAQRLWDVACAIRFSKTPHVDADDALHYARAALGSMHKDLTAGDAAIRRVAELEEREKELVALYEAANGRTVQQIRLRDVYNGQAKRAEADLAAARAETIAVCARVARNATLPPQFQWGDEALEQFNNGKEYAAKAIEAMALRDILAAALAPKEPNNG